MQTKNSNVVSIAQLGFCSGCGVCAAVCPHEVLAMETNRVGEYVPKERVAGCTQCGICLKTCPFVEGNPDEDAHGQSLFSPIEGVDHCTEAGYYHACFVGHAPQAEMRWAATSGGMLTWTLCDLLTRGEIDSALVVRPNNDPGKLYHFAVVSSIEEVMACSKTSYYPVELSDVLRHVLEHPGRVAVVELPCVCKAVRNAQNILPKLQTRIRYVLGLVCASQQVNKHFSQAVAHLAGADDALVGVGFRVKKEGVSPRNYVSCVETAAGSTHEISFFDGVKDLWASGAFKLQGCTYCDDAFAECADAAFMDAWLPDYEHDPAGHSIVLSRRSEWSARYRQVETLSRIDIDSVVQSQAVHAKRDALRTRLFLNRLGRRPAPRKRVVAAKPPLKGLLKTLVGDSRICAARKNLAAGRPYDAPRLETIPFMLIQSVGALACRLASGKK